MTTTLKCEFNILTKLPAYTDVVLVCLQRKSLDLIPSSRLTRRTSLISTHSFLCSYIFSRAVVVDDAEDNQDHADVDDQMEEDDEAPQYIDSDQETEERLMNALQYVVRII